VLRVLTADQKRTRMKISEHCLEYLNKNETGFVHRFVTMNETWIHHYTLESKQWTEGGFSALKKARSVPSAGKFLALVFWDAEGIWFVDNIE
jgi:hypothetical protein